ncbi:LRR receptor-like serine/threonine-protein kinase FLS2 [Vigna unguiculata]|uniref:LRR receptor-like serine/threonine-protein kinase FLS2 n=1 Tax=Vigna unguiculata TaxID=3917 RepID=A0A4D6M1T2_VIGUN|nr:LRR receptor-like serine/threonine-protein kinase FLS2 [Vigna unguiculata]
MSSKGEGSTAPIQGSAIVDDYGMLSSWTTPHCCQWKGIRCSNLTAHILSLDLHGEFVDLHLSGEIHKSLMELPQLQYLNLSYNSFEDSHIPEFIGSLKNLKYLDLFSCRFSGKIPSQFGSLSHLRYLNLAGNSLGGSIPRQLGNLSQLQELYLADNSFEGNVPSQLGNLFQLQVLSLGDSSFEGNVPSQLGNLSHLQELYIIGHHALKIDDGGQWLSNLISLTHLYLDSVSNLNRSHTWLHVIGKLPKLRELGLIDCSLSDYFILSSRPFKFNSSTSLSVLDLSFNTFTSPMIFEWVSNITSSLVELHLISSLQEGSTSGHFGMAMNSLRYLDLRSNTLKGRDLKSFTNICTLYSLNLHMNNLTEDLPSILDHLSSGCVRHSLRELDLSNNHITGNLPELSVFSSLKALFLDQNHLSGEIPQDIILPPKLESLSIQWNSIEGRIPKSFGNACALCLLDMSSNSLSEEFSVIIHHLSGCSRNSLQELSLQGNKINGTFPDLSIFLALKKLDLTENQLSGKISEGSKLPPSLEYLSIQLNKFEGGIPKSFGNACALRSLDMSKNSFSEEFPRIIHHLSGCARYSLEELDINCNQINGTLPDFSIFTSLKGLYLYINKLNGEIPKNIQFPPQLEKLHMYSNYLRGVLTDYNFANVSRLRELYLSDNSLALEFTQNWVPPFQLFFIKLRSCKLGPTFPKWLKTQNKFYYIDISNASISDVVPEWFWGKLSLQEGMTIDISYNKLRGIIPNIPQKFLIDEMSLRSNQFEGPIPLFLRNSGILDLSKNEFSDSTLFLCLNGTIETLYQLDISNNQLSGQIPDCWSHFKSLIYLDLSYNNFSGKIPTSMGSLFNLQALLLRNNNLISEIPLPLRSCTELVMLDMAENKLSGLFPAWIGSNYKKLQFLSLGSNNFYGTLPMQICYLKNIQLLDLSINNLFGKIPKCIKNFVVMADNMSSIEYHDYSFRIGESGGTNSYELNGNLTWKGSKQMFMNDELSLLKGIDLSSNHFSEEIPMEIEDLFGLILLNLSRNNLIGKIPSNIGKLASLEFLDLSRNQLVGSIPTSLTQIDRLTMLDLSHNYLSGNIPVSTQLQSFSTSSYEDNLDLCGLPLEKLCINEEPTQDPNVKVHDDEYSLFNNDFFISMSFGFVISFWMVFGSILLKRSWRHAYFKFLISLADNINDKVSVFTMIFKVDTD